MILGCNTCGFSSKDRAFFRRERCGFLGLPRSVCEGCAAHRPNAQDRRHAGRFVAGQLLWLLAIVAGFQYGRSEGFSMIVALAASIASLELRVGIHELGHALTAKLVGVKAIKVVIGSGPRRRSLRFADIPIELRRYAFGGGHTLHVNPKPGWARWAMAAILFSGAGANLASAAVAGLLGFGLGQSESLPAQAGLAVITGFIVSSVWMGLTNLLPFKIQGEIVSRSDGWQILNLLRVTPPASADDQAVAKTYVLLQAEQYQDAADTALAAAPASSHALYLWSSGLHALSKSAGDRTAVDCYLANEDQIFRAGREEDPEQRRLLAWVMGTVAWSALRSGDPALYALADRLSDAALVAVPDGPELMATRGAWLVEAGQAEAGVALLTTALRAVSDPRDKADFCGVLARGLRSQGDAGRADAFAGLQRHILAGLPAQ